MPVTVHIPGPLRGYADGATQVMLDGAPATLLAALDALGARFPGVRDRVLDEQGRQRTHVNLFVDRESIRYTGGLATPLGTDATLSVVPAVSGG